MRAGWSGGPKTWCACSYDPVFGTQPASVAPGGKEGGRKMVHNEGERREGGGTVCPLPVT